MDSQVGEDESEHNHEGNFVEVVSIPHPRWRCDPPISGLMDYRTTISMKRSCAPKVPCRESKLCTPEVEEGPCVVKFFILSHPSALLGKPLKASSLSHFSSLYPQTPNENQVPPTIRRCASCHFPIHSRLTPQKTTLRPLKSRPDPQRPLHHHKQTPYSSYSSSSSSSSAVPRSPSPLHFHEWPPSFF